MASKPSPDSLRYEIKMACQEAAYERVLTVLRLAPQGVRKLYPPRRVQSIYLDTDTNRALAENLAGISHREKIRIRWYGDDTRGVQATIERKVRENMLGWKDTFKLASPIDVEGVERRAFLASVEDQATPEWKDALRHGLQPVQWISYLRDYFRTGDGRVRITVDRELRCADQRHLLHLSPRLQTPIPRVLVIEAKCSREDHDAAQEILSRLPLFVDRCSKFVLASEPQHGPVPSLIPL